MLFRSVSQSRYKTKFTEIPKISSAGRAVTVGELESSLKIAERTKNTTQDSATSLASLATRESVQSAGTSQDHMVEESAPFQSLAKTASNMTLDFAILTAETPTTESDLFAGSNALAALQSTAELPVEAVLELAAEPSSTWSNQSSL